MKIVFLVGAFTVASGEWVQKERDVRPYDAKHSLWTLEKNAPADHEVTMTVALRVEEDRRAMLEKVFWEVSNPKHEKYGKHLTTDELTAILNVPQSQVDAVVEYFKQSGATSQEVHPNKDMLTVTMPVAAAETALNTTLGLFVHTEHSNVRIVRSQTTYHLPDSIADHVSMVGELMQFPRMRLKSLQNLASGAGSWPNQCSARGCNGLVTPEVLAQRYKFPNPSNTTNAASSMAVAEFQGQYFKDSDLKAFGTSCHRDVTVDKIIGGDTQSAGVEAELDIEYIKSVAPNVPLTVIYSGEYSLLKWANQITSLDNSPLVHSVSYGNDEVQQSSRQYMLTCNTAFMKAGAKGISILFASGDQGVCGRSGCGLFTHARFHPDFPAGSPYITAVGGTDFAGTEIGDETAWSASGGGFSDNFDIPSYQKDAVAAYKASADADLPPKNLWNNTGRGYPDIAALGGQKAPYCVAVNGLFQGVAGTSASCPVTAGVFALLNGLRASQNKSPLGFLNPFIYQNAAAFQDVTSGCNGGGKKYCFKAIKGWDASTGLGTPNYEALAKVVMEQDKHSASIVV
jgi:tripeptidyl-peptidase-1